MEYEDFKMMGADAFVEFLKENHDELKAAPPEVQQKAFEKFTRLKIQGKIDEDVTWPEDILTEPAPAAPDPGLDDMIEDEQQQPAEKASPVVLLTKEEALKKWKQNPKIEKFECFTWKGFALSGPAGYIKFQNGEIFISDIDQIRQLMNDRTYNVHVFAENPLLRNVK